MGQALHSVSDSHGGANTHSARPPQPMAAPPHSKASSFPHHLPSYHTKTNPKLTPNPNPAAVQPSKNLNQNHSQHGGIQETVRPLKIAGNVSSFRKDVDHSSEPTPGPSGYLKHETGPVVPSGRTSRYATGPVPSARKPQKIIHGSTRDKVERRDSISFDFDAIIANIAKKR